MHETDGTEPPRLPGALSGRLIRAAVAAMLFGLMMVTVVDVVGRSVFDRPLRGGYELSGLLLLVLFFVALPLATAGQRHITVNLIDKAAGPRLQAALHLFYTLAGAAVMIALAVYVARSGFASQRYHEATMLLRLPIAPFKFFAALSLGLTGLVLLWSAGARLRGRGT